MIPGGLPRLAAGRRGIAGEFSWGYTRCLEGHEGFLEACHDILSGAVSPWFGEPLPPDGILVENGAVISPASEIRGTLWAMRGASAGAGAVLENCVIMEGAFVPGGCRMRNCLVSRGYRVPAGTVADDKYLKVFGGL
jgi:NDP-sugar pyrophosphorylase family protein